jgi:hypothetical protein
MKIEWVDYEMMRGLEVVRNNPKEHRAWCHVYDDEPQHGHEEEFGKCTCATYVARYHSWRDFLHLYIDIRYLKEFLGAMGWWRFIYVKVFYPEMTGVIFYLFPIGVPIVVGRWLRGWWFLPFRYLHARGYTNVTPGARPALFWLVHVRFRRLGRPGDKGTA